MRRYEYVLDLGVGLSSSPPADPSVRPLVREDAGLLAELMLDAYLDTIDYEGETLEDARREVGGTSPDRRCSTARGYASLMTIRSRRRSSASGVRAAARSSLTS